MTLATLLAACVISAGARAASSQAFVEIAAEVGIVDSVITGGVCWADYDSDGDLDLFTAGSFFSGQEHLYRQDENGLFTDVAGAAGLHKPDGADSFGAQWGDYDGDGDLDLFVLDGLIDKPQRLYRNNGDGTFTDVADQARVDAPGNSQASAWGDYDADGELDLLVVYHPRDMPGQRNRLYRNQGDTTFEDVWPSVGGDAWGLGAAWADYDGDADLDLYIPASLSEATLPSQPSQLYRNDGDGTFTEIAAAAGVADNPVGLGVAWGDFDGDMDLDLYVVNNGGRNRFFRNDGDDAFVEIGEMAGVGDEKTGFGNTATWADYDNDGHLDLFVTNLASSNPNRMFRNLGDGTFASVASEVGVEDYNGGGVSWGDFDSDGDIDLFVGRLAFDSGGPIGARNLLYRNDGSTGNWLHVDLEGTRSSPDAIGAQAVAVTADRRIRRDVDGGSGLNTQPDLSLEFGLANAEVVDSLIITWPTGGTQVLTDVAANQAISVTESMVTAVTENMVASTPASFNLSQNYPNPFNPNTTIRFDLPQSADVELNVYNMTGQSVAELVSGLRQAGSYSVRWDGKDDSGRDLASGMYLYRLIAGDHVETRKLMLLR